MNGLWYIVIGFAVVAIILAIIGEALFRMNKHKKSENTASKNLYFTSIISGILCFFTMVFAIIIPLSAKQECAKYKIKGEEIVNLLIKSETDPENIGINNVIVSDYLDWYSEAKGSQELFGCFSGYYGIDLSEYDINYLYEQKLGEK